MRLHIFKGGPIHKPIILASSDSFIYLLNNLYGKIIININKPIFVIFRFFGSEESI